MEKTNEHLEVLYSQIDAEARAIAKKITKYDPDTDEELGEYKPRQVAYEHIVKWYKAGATPYGEKLADMQEMKDRYEKALKEIESLPTTSGTPENWLAFAIRTANEALNPKQSTDGNEKI